MVENVFAVECVSEWVCVLHEMTSYIIPTSHSWMFDQRQTQKASGIERRGPGAGHSDTLR